jgi:hypothetical protein
MHIVSDVKQIEIQTAEPLVPEPNPFEIEIAVANLKICKSPDIDPTSSSHGNGACVGLNTGPAMRRMGKSCPPSGIMTYQSLHLQIFLLTGSKLFLTREEMFQDTSHVLKNLNVISISGKAEFFSFAPSPDRLCGLPSLLSDR